MYTANTGVDLYFDNVLQASSSSAAHTKPAPGSNIVIGRLRVDEHAGGQRYCHVTIDYFTIWDKPFNETEKELTLRKTFSLQPFIENFTFVQLRLSTAICVISRQSQKLSKSVDSKMNDVS